MSEHAFQAESSRLLDLMINSIYTHKEIFLRELLSNASDALDKLYYLSLSDENMTCNREDMQIVIEPNKELRTLTIRDNGIGMTEQELCENLGTIAKSGSFQFKNGMEAKDDVDIIGQFGVGFYSAFMVSSRVTVLSRSIHSEQGYRWTSTGTEGFDVEPADVPDHGTTIILSLREDTEDEHYSEFLDEYRIRELVKKYSDYIRYPIRMEVTKSRPKPKAEDAPEDAEPEYESYTEMETLNSMVPLWRRNKNELKPEDYNAFYKEKFMDWNDPLKYIHLSTEGTLTFQALLFIPAHAPYDFYTREYEKGLQLYSSGVFIMDKCADLLPEHFRFVRGLVDSQDLSLNISREMLQHDRQLKAIANYLEKRIRTELSSMLENDREKYEQFWKEFGLQLKYGAYSDYGSHRELADLLLFHSSSENKPVTFKEYVSRMEEGQKEIYYCAGKNAEQIDRLPVAERVKSKGFEVLYLTDDVDEFCLQMLGQYDEKPFKNIASGDLDLGDEEEKAAVKEKTEQSAGLLSALKEALNGKVEDVRLSERLVTYPVCLTTEGAVSLEMEKTLGAMPGSGPKPKARRILELNPNHNLFAAMQRRQEAGESLDDYADILYNQALLIEGLPVEDPVALTNKIADLLARA